MNKYGKVGGSRKISMKKYGQVFTFYRESTLDILHSRGG